MAATSSSDSSKLEFAVQMSCDSCANAIRSALVGVNGIHLVDINVSSEQVLIDTTLTSGEVQALIESTGRRAVLKGMGPTAFKDLGAAVAMLGPEGDIKGAVRFLQLSEKQCLIEGTIDGLKPGLHGLHVHEFGDLTSSCLSCGDHYNPGENRHGGPDDTDRHVGDLGNIHANEAGRANFRIQDSRLKVWDIIGRSVVVDSSEDDLGRGDHPLSRTTGNSGDRLACGIIARSAGLFQNPKKICSCDGVTLWEERDRPIAGTGRKSKDPPAANL
ncbi:copper chaperone for superoxide dismutase-like isoform X1 [Carcharodon carcharias]|uniref:copper chaperone for superoxide dismutase-like isoform X1 n=1 Tax=Carcharodon carcharias TaxID=13397 RepID=UPI001B7DF703|nr:copper chaperone for superoxide dismutase-like isoform X1 [Carcharodon carcharias]